MATPAIERTFDGHHRTTGQKTMMTGFRIFEVQHKEIMRKYPGNTSALVRLLLSKYLDGELPAVEAEFRALINL